MAILKPIVIAVGPASLISAEALATLIGVTRTHVAIETDTLLELARENGLRFVEIAAGNPGVDPWLPCAGMLAACGRWNADRDPPKGGLSPMAGKGLAPRCRPSPAP